MGVLAVLCRKRFVGGAAPLKHRILIKNFYPLIFPSYRSFPYRSVTCDDARTQYVE